MPLVTRLTVNRISARSTTHFTRSATLHVAIRIRGHPKLAHRVSAVTLLRKLRCIVLEATTKVATCVRRHLRLSNDTLAVKISCPIPEVHITAKMIFSFGSAYSHGEQKIKYKITSSPVCAHLRLLGCFIKESHFETSAASLLSYLQKPTMAYSVDNFREMQHLIFTLVPALLGLRLPRVRSNKENK